MMNQKHRQAVFEIGVPDSLTILRFPDETSLSILGCEQSDRA
jgi:hypothetical protein